MDPRDRPVEGLQQFFAATFLPFVTRPHLLISQTQIGITMLITPLPISSNLPARMRSALNPILDELESMTLKQVKERCGVFGQRGLKMAAEGTISRHQSGGIKSIALETYTPDDSNLFLLPGYLSQNRFHCEFTIDSGMLGALVGLGHGLSKYILDEEVKRRIDAGFRELIFLTDDHLKSLSSELKAAANWHWGYCNVALEEKFLLKMVDHEQSTRNSESAHSRLKAIRRMKPLIDKSQRHLRNEMERVTGEVSGHVRRAMHASISDAEALALECRHQSFFKAIDGL
ncbi:hypothetical protein [Primorskyibacter flagellatus]|uniref:hypothetical protein n=1 Tax=Primorskyibacter flagellatus TaxID=1387277 RepID=UPI001669D08B|nr:hypothetical protein [Primorskyibacter flagellatus]